MINARLVCLCIAVVALAAGCTADNQVDTTPPAGSVEDPPTHTTAEEPPAPSSDTASTSIPGATSSTRDQTETPDTTGPESPATTHPPTTDTTQADTTTTTTLAPLGGLRYEPVLTDVRGILDHEGALPVQLVGRPGDEYSYLITREGRVWILEEDTFSNPPVLDLRDATLVGAETGLLGIALHPSDPHRMFLHHTDLQFDIVVAEYRLDESLRTAVPSSGKTLLKVTTSSDFHKGGMLQFGPDGYLYIGVGDGGLDFNGQDPTSRLGAILRIDVDGGDPYSIPTDHPPITADAPEVYIYGIRNPWRFWIDPSTNVIYIGDVGALLFEEIDITSLDSPGANFGWSILEGHEWGPFKTGQRCRENPQNCDTSTFIPPALVLAHGADACAVIGGVVYRGPAIPELDGHYFYSDFCGGFLRSFRWDGSLAVDLRDWTGDVEKRWEVLSFGVDTQGEMYVLTSNEVFRIVPVR